MPSIATPEQEFRAYLGILQLAKTDSAARLKAARQRRLTIGSCSYGSVASILRNGFDRAFHEDPTADTVSVLHENIRGFSDYNTSIGRRIIGACHSHPRTTDRA